MNKKTFIKNYVQAIRDGNAAVFAGAGLSRASGFVEWKELLRDMATDIGLDVDKETDFISLAQYYKNERSRDDINQTIMDKFSVNVALNQNVEILTGLPIYTYWTTNYDKLIERGLESHGRFADVKIKKEQLSLSRHGRDAIVYKMHGDVDDPAHAILTKEDYETYDEKYPLFRTVLKGDLVAKTFLFIGFSFEDPNLEFVLSRISHIMQDQKRSHYCFFRKVQRQDFENEADFIYKNTVQSLREKELHRYGINTVFVDEYNEITEILEEIRTQVYLHDIYIGASLNTLNGSRWNEVNAADLAYKLSYELINNGYSVTNGFGYGMGSDIIKGATAAIQKDRCKNMDDYLKLKPFPQNFHDDVERTLHYHLYRENMLKDVGICIFMFGNKQNGNISAGLLEEFEIASKSGKYIIPLASTGYAAAKILQEMLKHMDSYKYLEDYVERLKQTLDVNELVKLVFEILDTILVA